MAHLVWRKTSLNLATSTYHTLLHLLPITYSSSFPVCFPSVQSILCGMLCCIGCMAVEQNVNVKQASFCFPLPL